MISSAKGDADQHRLAARFADGPQPSAPGKAEHLLTDWLADLEPSQAAAIGDLRLGDAHPGLSATLAIPARAGAGDRLAAQTPDVPQKVA